MLAEMRGCLNGLPPRIQKMSIPMGLIAGHEGLRDGCALLRDYRHF